MGWGCGRQRLLQRVDPGQVVRPLQHLGGVLFRGDDLQVTRLDAQAVRTDVVHGHVAEVFTATSRQSHESVGLSLAPPNPDLRVPPAGSAGP